jgi:hypothetical protein
MGSAASLRPVACAACVLAAAVTAGSDAHGFCRQITATPPAGYDPTTQGCFGAQTAGSVFEVYWANLCVGYSVQRGASRQVTLDQATAAAAQAFAAWTQTTCSGGGSPSVTAVDEGPVDCGLVEYDDDGPNQHVIVFRDDGWPYDDSSNTLGLTTVTYDVTDGEIYDADIEINSHDYTLVASGPVPAGAYDLQTVLTHEAGHFLGLAHSADTTAMMYAHYQPGLGALGALPPDDTDGICSIYPPGGERSTSAGELPGEACDPTPRHGFSTSCAGASTADAGGDPGAGDGAAGDAPSSSGCSLAATRERWPGLAGAFFSAVSLAALRRRRRRLR